MSDYLHAKTENVQIFLDNCLKKQKQELIDKFLVKLKNLPIWSSKDNIFTVNQEDINLIIEEYEGENE